MARILIIDDEPGVVKSLSEWLKMHGHEVECSYTAEEGWRLSQESAPELILTDLCLPDRSGLRLCQQFRQSPVTADVPLVILSALSEEYESEAERLGVKHFISKPFDLQTALQTIERVLGDAASPPESSGASS